MAIFDNVIHVLLMLLLLFGSMVLIGLIKNISIYVDERRRIDVKVLTEGKKPYITLQQKSVTTLSVIDTIDKLITMEIEDTLKTYARLNEKYNSTRMAEDIESISNRVYNALKKTVYESDDIILTDEYIMNYIVTHTTISFIRIVKGLNDVIREA